MRKLAAALSASGGTKYDAHQLPFQTIKLSADRQVVSFDVGTRRWSCDIAGAKCTAAGEAAGARGAAVGGRGAAGRGGGGRGSGAGNTVPSPDGKQAAFIRNWNLWVRDLLRARKNS